MQERRITELQVKINRLVEQNSVLSEKISVREKDFTDVQSELLWAGLGEISGSGPIELVLSDAGSQRVI